ncbi:MAG: FAD-dependent oxidoreductase [Mucilaginibacter sp.]
MIKRIPLYLLLFTFSFAHAETIKTDVLVIGGGPSGVAAAIQSAHSKIKTLLIEPSLFLGGITKAGGTVILSANRDLPSGLWGEFRKKITAHYRNTPGYDTTYNAILRFEPYDGAEILKKWTDTVKNLTVKLGTSWKSIKKDGTGWDVTAIINNETVTIEAKVVIDATDDGAVAEKAGIKLKDKFDVYNDHGNHEIYRTAIATGAALPGERNTTTVAGVYPAYPAYCIPMNAILTADADNLLTLNKALPGNNGIQFFPVQMNLGQGAGTVAAFCAFFKTTTKNLNVRIVQGELLDFKGYLLPFTDVPQRDPHFRAIQQVSATGLLKGIQKTKGNAIALNFEPDAAVKTDEIKPILTEMYTRAFLWFNKEKPGTQFTVGNLVSLISDYTLTDPKTLQIYLEKAWPTTFKLNGTFDLTRPVTRLEFAVLANRYLNPFARRVDLNWKLNN